MKRTFRIKQEWLVETEAPEEEDLLMEVIIKMLEMPTPVLILQGWQITAKQLDTETEFVEIQTCRICGCTDDDCSQCIEATGYPCHWVEENLCSRCAPPH